LTVTTTDNKDNKRKALKPPFNPYDVIIVGLDSHPNISADFKPDPKAGITEKDAERRRKLYVQLFDERALLKVPKERIALTMAWGVQVPIQYIPFLGDVYVVDGRQRVMAARAVWDEQKRLNIEPEHMITVPGIEFEGDVDQLFAASRAMNVHTDEPPMMKARSMTRLLMEDIVDEDGDKPRKRTVQEVAAIYGCSDQHVRDMTKLFESSDTVKKALEELKQPTIGLLLTGLPEDQQVKVLEELKAEHKGGAKVTVDRARKKVAEAKGKTVNSPKDKVDTIQRTLQKLADKAAEVNCTNCKTQNEATHALSMLLAAVDAIARAAFGGGKVAFPVPINKQKPGYTLEALAKVGD
jgi:hypothetical protein